MTGSYVSSVHSGTIYSREKILWKLTALWGFSEAALGGLLHGFKIPFTGLFVGGASIIFITLIAFFSEKNGNIFRATIIVIIIKGMVSPHTPVTAYFAVLLQGLLGEGFFFSRKFFRISAIFLAITVMLFSASQKLIILTIIFGQTLWTSIDDISSSLLTQFLIKQTQPINFSFSILIISLYAGIHFLSGIFIGIFAGKLPHKIISLYKEGNFPKSITPEDSTAKQLFTPSKHKRKWWQKKSGIAYLIISISFILLSFLFPEFGNEKSFKIILMFIRSIIIISLWYFFISPLLLRFINKLIKNKQSAYADEVLEMIGYFPRFYSIVKICWKNSTGNKFYTRMNLFLTQLFAIVLFSDDPSFAE